MSDRFVKGKEAQKIIGVTPQTLRKYDKEGLIETIRTPGGKRLYNVDKYLRDNKFEKATDEEKNIKKNICYCRVSTHGQKEDLERQIIYMQDRYPNFEIIHDVGSGINFNRHGLQKIIDLAIENKLGKLVIAYKDRLCRIGYNLIEYILLKYSNTEIIIENEVTSSPEEEVVNDLLQIITVFGARVNGMRSYKGGDNDIKI